MHELGPGLAQHGSNRTSFYDSCTQPLGAPQPPNEPHVCESNIDGYSIMMTLAPGYKRFLAHLGGRDCRNGRCRLGYMPTTNQLS